MAVGKGSMARASKAAAKTAVIAKPAEEVKKVIAEPVSEKAAGDVIVYEKSSQMLDRDAEPEEIFGVGDAMPVYYF